jgi:hypothetical protein
LFALAGSPDEPDAVALPLSEGIAPAFSFVEKVPDAGTEFVLAGALSFGFADGPAAGRDVRSIASRTICANAG